jgi:hypothetical protein
MGGSIQPLDSSIRFQPAQVGRLPLNASAFFAAFEHRQKAHNADAGHIRDWLRPPVPEPG